MKQTLMIGRSPLRGTRSVYAALVSCGLIVMLLSAPGCTSGGRSRPLFKVVPAGSLMAVSLNWRAVGKDSELKRLLKTDSLEPVFEELGITSAQVSDVSVFSDAQLAGSMAGSNGIILRGTFDARAVRTRLSGQGWGEESYEGQKLWTHGTNSGQLCAVLKSGLVVCGTRGGVKGVIDTERGESESFADSPANKRMIARLRKNDFPIVMIAVYPQETQDMAEVALQSSSALLDFARFGGLGSLLEKIGYVRGFGCAVSREGGTLPLEMLALMKDEQAASLVSGSLNIVQKLTHALPQHKLSQSEANDLRQIQNIAVTREQDLLSIKAVIPVRNFRRVD
ncbi:MAG TPA: hypothetical protein VF656_10760 [Pyrinomonadaceae bacterium]|jgi:hypothetical protein